MKIYKIDAESIDRTYDVRNKMLRKCRGKVYFFDKDFIWRSIPVSEANKLIYDTKWHDEFEIGHQKRKLFKDSDFRVVNKILPKLQIGDHISKLIELAEQTTIEVKTEEEREKEKEKELKNRSEIENFIIRVRPPEIYRTKDNKKKKTFDFIEVTILIRESFPEKKKFIEQHKKELFQMAVDKIKDNKRFQSFGIPIGTLCVKSIQLFSDSSLVWIFELKKELRDMEDKNE